MRFSLGKVNLPYDAFDMGCLSSQPYLYICEGRDNIEHIHIEQIKVVAQEEVHVQQLILYKCASFRHETSRTMASSQYDSSAMGKSIFSLVKSIPEVNFFNIMIGWMLANAGDTTLELNLS